ncbi:glycoside hydrolase family 3 C-terminal domain-containing protein [Pseudomonas purpurea]|uniref:beta-glucosidase n=1 Tax=Pseudomonas purpurea TaxID=3136737 RepID=UPI0032678D52
MIIKAGCYLLSLSLLSATPAMAAGQPAEGTPQQRATALTQSMTLDEKISLLHLPFGLPVRGTPIPPGALGTAAYWPGISRLNLPALHISDASLGVANPSGIRVGDNATAMPSGLALAATFDPALARAQGEVIGQEAHAKGFAVMLAGGVNLTREPRNGRNFEYLGEDPLLAGTLAGQSIAGIQSRNVVSTIKHFALNAQETGKVMVSSNLQEAAARESDLLAFQLAIETGKPGAVMTGYNRINGVYAEENDFLINQVLKGDWNYPGWVMSDWGATHSTEKAVLAGLDQQSGENLDPEVFFGAPLKKAVTDGAVSQARLDDMVSRILRSLFAVGSLDNPATVAGVDFDSHARVAQRIAEQGIVLLKNDHNQLPLAKNLKRIVVIGRHADKGVLSGGGSSQVIPVGSLRVPSPVKNNPFIDTIIYHPSSPLDAIRAHAGKAEIVYNDGSDLAKATQLAGTADAVILFAEQWMAEAIDARDLSLPNDQERLIQAIAAANPRTVVVLETGGPVKMPWLKQVPAVVEAWYSGSRGGQAIAGVLFGRVNPSGRLPMTFPQDEQQLPRPLMQDPATTTSNPGEPRRGLFDVSYDIEGADVGYKWFAREGKTPLFPFGHGLSYTRFSYDQLHASVDEDARLVIRMAVTNHGGRAGTDTPQFYVKGLEGVPARLAGWQRITLAPGETGQVSVTVDPRLLARFDSTNSGWHIRPGQYRISAGINALEHPLSTQIELKEQRLAP